VYDISHDTPARAERRCIEFPLPHDFDEMGRSAIFGFS
jgi:hypothetical protein